MSTETNTETKETTSGSASKPSEQKAAAKSTAAKKPKTSYGTGTSGKEHKPAKDKPGKTVERSKMTVPEQRAGGVPGALPINGRVDNMTRRDDHDVLEGHFCVIDLSNKDAVTGVEELIGDGNARPGSGDYGVYIGPASIGEDGYPVDARVLLRDEHSGQVVVPYKALFPSQAGGRR